MPGDIGVSLLVPIRSPLSGGLGKADKSSQPATSSWRPMNRSQSGQNWTASKELVLPHSGYDNQNDSGIS